mgnify:CR=1 FL=1
MAVTFEPRTVAFGDMIIVRGAYEAGDTTINLSDFFRPSGVEMFDMTSSSHEAVTSTFTVGGGAYNNTANIDHTSSTEPERGMVAAAPDLATSVITITSNTRFVAIPEQGATTAGSAETITFTHGIIGVVPLNETNTYFNFIAPMIEDTFTLADATNVITLLSGVKTTAGAKTAGTFMAMGRRG